MNDLRVVWVLGAGFSKPLGGPLLFDLFTLASLYQRQGFYPASEFPHLHSPAAGLAFEMYRKYCNKPGNEPKLWDDPEQFLDRLDTASDAESPDTRAMMTLALAAWRPFRKDELDFAAIAAAGRRLLACECAAFLHENACRGDRWRPYQHWARRLNQRHVVVTFNYDRVLETLQANSCGGFHMMMPGARERPDADRVSGTILLKLHGSVDWILEGEQYKRSENVLSALTCEPQEMAIATPGFSKAKTVRSFAGLWDTAEWHLANDDVIIFVGYRFPESDAEARMRLLTAIGQNASKQLLVKIVLGPNSSDAQRLQHMINLAAPNAIVDIVPLWGQEYLSLFDEQQLVRQREKIRDEYRRRMGISLLDP